MPTIFALCDLRAQVPQVQARAPEAALIALTPDVAWYCQEHDLPYVRLDDFTADAAINELGDATLFREYAWARWMDTTLAQVVPEFGAAGFAPARAQLYFLKRTFDNFLLPAFQLRGFLAAAKPARLITFARPPFVPGMDVLSIGRPLHSLLAPALAGNGVQVEVWTAANEEPVPAQNKLERWLRLGRRLAPWIGRQFANWRPNPLRPSRRLAWVGSRGYDLERVVPLLQRRGIAVVRPGRLVDWARGNRRQVEQARSALQAAQGTLLGAPEMWQVIDPVGPALRPHVEHFLRWWLLAQVPRSWAEFLGARNWLRRGQLSALIGTEVQSTLTSSTFLAAEALGLPRLMHIHNGGMFQDLPVHDSLGPIQSDVYYVNGQGDADYFDRLGSRLDVFPRARFVPVGSARLDALRTSRAARRAPQLRARLQSGDQRPLVLYVPTSLLGCYHYFNEGHFSDVAYFELQERLLRCCAEFPNIRMLYKPFPMDYTVNPIREFIARCTPAVEVVSDGLGELIWAVDAIIIDFSATAVTEAALTDKPLLVYAGRDWARLLPEARTALARRARLAETPADVEAQLRQFLQAGDFLPCTSGGEEFLRLYCTHLADGRSAERVADSIAQVVQQ